MSLKGWLTERLIAPTRDSIVREVDRATKKLESGQSVQEVLPDLHQVVAQTLSRVKLPEPLGSILTGIIMVAPWDQWAKLPAHELVAVLKRFHKQVEGIRL